MVNEKHTGLLAILRQGPLSGETVAARLGMSRVALWKRIEVLRAAGYEIVADRSGYRLVDEDKPLPWEFPGAEAAIRYFDTVGSTMDLSFGEAVAGEPEGFTVISDRQTSGRGCRDRPWSSLSGNLHFTLLTRPAIPLAFVGALVLESLCMLKETLEELYGLRLSIKWPNDLMADGKKLGGILAESSGRTDRCSFVNIGVGLNVRKTPRLVRPIASVEGLSGAKADRREILARFRRRQLAWCAAPKFEARKWESSQAGLGGIRAELWTGERLQGTFSGFESDGSLLLSSGSKTRSIRPGTAKLVDGDTA